MKRIISCFFKNWLFIINSNKSDTKYNNVDKVDSEFYIVNYVIDMKTGHYENL